jgi:hypothetical protein
MHTDSIRTQIPREIINPVEKLLLEKAANAAKKTALTEIAKGKTLATSNP